MKDRLLNLLCVGGAFAPCRWARRRQAMILTYHRFGGQEGGVRISARAFAQQLAYLKAHYRLVPLSQLAAWLGGDKPIPSRLAAVTIDDGYRDAYEVAFPLLRKYRVPATVFVVSDFVEGKRWLWTDQSRYLTARASRRHLTFAAGDCSLELFLGSAASREAAAEKINAALKALPEDAVNDALQRLANELDVPLPAQPPAQFASIDWEQAREMADGGVEIGSHTVTHPILPRLNNERLREELRRSKTHIETELRRKVESFCYPNGDYDSRALLEAASAGYQCAVTTESGWNDRQSNPLALRRIHGEYDLPHFVQSTSGFEQIKNHWRRKLPIFGEAAGKELAAS